MHRYLLQRLVGMVVMLLLVSLLSYSIVRLLPGDPAVAMLGEGGPGGGCARSCGPWSRPARAIVLRDLAGARRTRRFRPLDPVQPTGG
jgi:ABC-type dipeptide/oligopeptide/nickel transport system permease component